MMRRGPLQLCAAIGCGRVVPRWQRLCSACFKQLPWDIRADIVRAGEARNALARADAVKRGVAWLAEHSPAAIAARQLGEAPP